MSNSSTSKSSNFLFGIQKLPFLSNWVHDVNVPAISLGEIRPPHQRFDLSLPGSKLEYSKLVVTVLVDSEFKVYKEIFNWMQEMRDPDGEILTDVLSDATLTILSNHKNPLFTIDFQDVFPVDISELSLSVANPTDLIFTVTLSVNGMTISNS